MEDKTCFTVYERKQRALNTLNSAYQTLEKIPEQTWLDHVEIFKALLTDPSNLRWQLNQIDKDGAG